ncbi:Skeletal muscle and kidney-enriched inositol phosphatase, putative [Pediculus humanus corporis]|uniref:Skeletal muscle and kidney-enriched inositol phosphatase, putative n=1 Tax=Pediculus humanus subsp. corporis TaxID=121224 RepID=E0V9K5_PEDHC|nr:Skeletal muscle and kidney-enriched inositol phosphatase, putative [Pediculus humanus corporis]EEB10061.1 Skeletal muscle and kidney-enriched inositol phosphatase, putative [Pediculus humanus corporis]
MDSLRIYIVSYNVACKPPEENLEELLGFEKSEENLPDFYIVGLQEVKAQLYNIVLDALLDDPWTIAFKQLKSKNYIKLKTVRLQGLILSIYSKKNHLLNVRDIEMQYIKTGLGGFWGNKGGVAIRMNVYGVSVCVVNTHLTPHDQNLQARIDDYNQIINTMNFVRQKETTSILFHDYVFWLGDHNFRIDEAISHEEILDKIKAKKLDWLKNVDQLTSVRRNGQAFSELIEEPFNFPPTYKYIFKTCEYDPKRRPAWTDRILYKVNANAYENITLSANMISYKSFPNYLVSDHKPIAGEFIFKVFSDYSDRTIEFNPVKTWYINEENIVHFTAEDIRISDWDWIGVYKHNFCALDDYVSFVYVNTVSTTASEGLNLNSMRRKEIKFPDGMVRTEGKYCLIYMTADSGSVLGISLPFEAKFKPGKQFYEC